MAQKNATLRALIEGVIYDLMPKGSVYNVWVDDTTTLAEKLAEVITSLNGKVTPEELTAAIEQALAGFEGGGNCPIKQFPIDGDTVYLNELDERTLYTLPANDNNSYYFAAKSEDGTISNKVVIKEGVVYYNDEKTSYSSGWSSDIVGENERVVYTIEKTYSRLDKIDSAKYIATSSNAPIAKYWPKFDHQPTTKEYVDVKIAEALSEFTPTDIPQGNWDQNDPEAADYIKNRTHYVEYGDNLVEILPTTNLITNEDFGGFVIQDAIELTAGKQYVVKFTDSSNNEVEYTTMCVEAPENGDGMKWILGDAGLVEGMPTTGEPFIMLGLDPSVASQMGVGALVLWIGEILPQTISISAQEEIVHKIDPKFLPEVSGNAVRYEAQTLTEDQKAQARINIGLDNAITFDTFPSEDVVNAMSDWTIFKTRGFYSKDDGVACAYVVKSSSGSLYVPYGSKYIAPYRNTALTDRDIYVDQYGVRRGDASYADSNSAIMNSLMSAMQSGYTLHFGSGQYYFSDPIVFADKYVTIKGESTNACASGTDVNIGAYLHFPTIASGEAAIVIGGGSVQDLGIIGNPSICDVSLDRTKTTSDPGSVVTLVDTGTSYGIKPGTWGYTIENVRIKNFTYGIYSETGNFLINGVTVRQCKVGISAGNDVKITNVQAWNVMTAVELRGQLASATNIRGDSIGKHLIECKNGKCLLSNIDGDYCVGSLIHYGGANKFIHLGQATACMGRVATKNAYSRSGSFDLRTVADADYEYCSYISIAPNTQVFGGHIELVNVSANPMDSSSGYVHPSAPISIGTGSTVKGVTIKCNVPYTADSEYFNRYVVKNLSTYAEASNDATNYLTDFDGKTVEDINFITPIGFVRTRRTSEELIRAFEFDSDVKAKASVVSKVTSALEVLVPGINLNDGVYEQGYFDSAGENHVGSYATQSFRNTNYLPVEGGRTVAIYYNKDTWNKQDKGKSLYIVQYDASKNIVVGRTEFAPYANGQTTFVLNSATAYVRLGFNKWAELGQELSTIKIALYYIEDFVSEFVEYGYGAEQTYGVIGEKVFLTSPNGTKFVLSVSDAGALSVSALNQT